MFFLDSTTRSIQVVLGTGKSTQDMPITATWIDVDSGFQGQAETTLLTTTNGTTPVVVIPPPSSDVVRKWRKLVVQNADSAAKVVTVQFNDNGTLYTMFSVTLQKGDHLEYVDGQVVQVYDANGNVK